LTKDCLPLTGFEREKHCITAAYKEIKKLSPVNQLFTGLKWHRRDEKIRTSDLQHPMLARYLATLHPEN
jgi:hypothetical protein